MTWAGLMRVKQKMGKRTMPIWRRMALPANRKVKKPFGKAHGLIHKRLFLRKILLNSMVLQT